MGIRDLKSSPRSTKHSTEYVLEVLKSFEMHECQVQECQLSRLKVRNTYVASMALD